MDLLKKRRTRTWAIYLLALLVISLALWLINPREGGMSSLRLGLAIGVIAAVLVPVALLAHKWRTLLKDTQAYQLKEMNLSQDELRQAVALWVYAQTGRGIEGDLLFSMESDGTISCSYYIPEE